MFGVLYGKVEQGECSETSTYTIQAPENYPKRKHTAFTTRQKFEIKKAL